MAASAAWRPIGTVLIESGAITPEDLDSALVEQKRSGRKLGEILIESGRITWLELAHAIAEQASDAEGSAAPPAPPAAAPAPAPPAALPAPAPPAAPPAPPAAPLAPPAGPVLVAPPLSAPAPPVTFDVPQNGIAERLETVEGMLKDRQRAFLELVSVTERLRATVARLQEELAERDAEIMRLRSGAPAARV